MVSPMLEQANLTTTPRTYGVEPRCAQTNGGECSSSGPPIPLTAVQHGSQFSGYLLSLSSKTYPTLETLTATPDAKGLIEEAEPLSWNTWNG